MATFLDGSAVPADGKYHVDPSNPMNSIRVAEHCSPPGVISFISGGNTGFLGELADGSVLKYSFDQDDRARVRGLDIEDKILGVLGAHERIVSYLGRTDHGLRFRRAANGDLRNYMSDSQVDITPNLRTRWAIQAAEAVGYIHSREVIHCDIHPNNFLLNDDLNLSLCDFSGSFYRGLDGHAMEATRYYLPRPWQDQPCVRSDMFALGSLLYYIMTGFEPYHTLSDDEVVTLFTKAEFPDVQDVIYGDVILSCWKGRFEATSEVHDALKRIAAHAT